MWLEPLLKERETPQVLELMGHDLVPFFNL